LSWTDCKAYVDERDNESFFAALPNLRAAGEGVNHDAEIADLFAELVRVTPNKKAELVKLLDAIASRPAPEVFETQVEDLRVKSINRLTGASYLNLEKAADFEEMVKYTRDVKPDLASEKMLACRLESLLRSPNPASLTKDAKACKEALDIAELKKLADSKDAYVHYARGLAANANALWARAADAYDLASLKDDELGWTNSARRAFAVEAYYNAAREAWKPGKDRATAALAVKRYQSAVALAAPMPVQHLLGFVEAARGAQDWKVLEQALGDLARRKEFKVLPSEVFSLESLGRISTIFVDWAEGSGDPARVQKLLQSIGPALQAVEKSSLNGEAFDFWVGVYYWELATNKPGMKTAALKAFGRSLAQSESTGDVSALGPRWMRVQELLEPVKTTDAPENWEKVFDAAIDPKSTARTDRQWELFLEKCVMAAYNKKRTDKLVDELRQAKNPSLVRDVEELIASKPDRVDLQIEAGLVLWAALANSYTPATKKGMTQEQQDAYIRRTKESSRRLASQLATKGVFEKWPRHDKAEITRKFAKEFGNLPKALRMGEDEAKEFLGRPDDPSKSLIKDILNHLSEYEQNHAKPERG
jgi:hypothetical protein